MDTEKTEILRISHDFIYLLSCSTLAAKWEYGQQCQRQNDRDNENNDFNQMAIGVVVVHFMIVSYVYRNKSNIHNS